MPREHFNKPIQTAEGDLIPNATVRLVDPTTDANFGEPIYTSLDGAETYPNPWATSNGVIDFYLDKPARLRIGVTAPGGEEAFFDNVEVGDAEVYMETLPFAVSGPQAVRQYGARYYAEDDFAVHRVRIAVGTPPTGADLIVDINRNGTSIFPSEAARPRIAAGTHTAFVDPEGVVITTGDYLTIDVDQVGTDTPGHDLTIQIRAQRLS